MRARFCALFAISCLSISILGCAFIGYGGKQTEDEIRILDSERRLAEYWASVLKLRSPIGSSDLEQGKTLYEQGRTANATWIDGFESGLVLLDFQINRKSEAAKLEVAVEARKKFTRFAEQVDSKFREQPPLLSTSGPSWLESATDILVKVAKAYKHANDQRKAKLVERLNAVRWKGFDDILAADPKTLGPRFSLPDDRL